MRRRTILTAGIGAAALAAAAVGLASGLPTGAKEPESQSLPENTTKIARQDLADTETKSGTLGYGSTTKVSSKANGTVTWLPAPGTVVQRGQPLYKVDDKPVILLYGSLPAYRPLSAGMTGNDVKQLTANLKALGYSDFTSSSIRRWQEKNGLSETGVVEPARVVYATGAVRVQSLAVAVSDDGGREILSYTGTRRVVTSTIGVDDSRLAKVDEKVSVTLPDGKVVQGTIESTRTVVEQAQQGDPTTVIEVTIGLGDTEVDFDQASVRVAFIATTRKAVLTVPVAALLALREGGYGVELIGDTGSRQIVAVTTGLFAGGMVEISGDGIGEGMTVGMPS